MHRAADELKARVIRSRTLENADCLQRVTPVTSRERDQLLGERDFVDAVVATVERKVEGRLASLRSCVRDTLVEEEQFVERVWGKRWRELAPGADVLAQVFTPFGGYSKRIDGPAIAGAMREPPEELRHIIAEFLRRRVRVSPNPRTDTP